MDDDFQSTAIIRQLVEGSAQKVEENASRHPACSHRHPMLDTARLRLADGWWWPMEAWPARPGWPPHWPSCDSGKNPIRLRPAWCPPDRTRW